MSEAYWTIVFVWTLFGLFVIKEMFFHEEDE